MSRYRIQFQRGLSLPEFLEQFGTRSKCEEHLYRIKWPEGFRCPKCGGHDAKEFNKGNHTVYQCRCCSAQTSLLVGTTFERTHVPLTKWFLAIYLISEAKTSISAMDLHRKIDVNHKTAWLMKHKLMEAMKHTEQKRKISGRIEMDDAYLGGKFKGGSRGRGSENKQPFIAAVQTDERKHPQLIKLDPVSDFTARSVEVWTREHVEDGSHIVTDSLKGFCGVEHTCTHEIHNASTMTDAGKEFHFKWVNTIISNMKTSMRGTFHSIECRSYAFRYFAAFTYRFNRRFDLKEVFYDLCRSAVESPPATYSMIRVL